MVGTVPDSLRENWLYQAAVYPLNILRRLFLPPSLPLGSAEYYSGASRLNGPEIRAALAGRYGAWTRYSSGGQRSVNLYSALPIREGEAVTGAVLISRSTVRILTDLYRLRLDMVRIFLLSLGAALVLSFLLARTITIPVKKLRDQAESFLDHRGRLTGQFRRLKNRDEIGDLSRSLDSLSGKLEERIAFISGFSADISHEMKNPVAAIRSAAELAQQEGSAFQEPLFALIRRESDRIQRLLEDLRDLSRTDAALEEEELEPVDLRAFAAVLATEWNRTPRENGAVLSLRDTLGEGEPLRVRAAGHRLFQCLSNLLDNAAGFSPEGGVVELRLSRRGEWAVMAVGDRGPGLSAGAEERVFDRFYTDREEGRKDHSGLGLAIVRSIAEGYGGRAFGENRPGGGALFSLELPVLPEQRRGGR